MHYQEKLFLPVKFSAQNGAPYQMKRNRPVTALFPQAV